MTYNLLQRFADLKKTVQKIESAYGIQISITCREPFSDDELDGGENWFASINGRPSAGHVDFSTIQDQMDSLAYFGEIGLLKGKGE